MKHVFTNRTIGAAFYAGNEWGRSGGNVYFEHGTLYSYGSHFPMAIRITDEVIAWNEDRYSNSTSKQQSQCYPYGKTIIPVDTVIAKEWAYWKEYGGEENLAGTIRRTVDYLQERKRACLAKESKARIDRTREYWKREVMKYHEAVSTVKAIHA